MESLDNMYYMLCSYYRALVVDSCLERSRSEDVKINKEVIGSGGDYNCDDDRI